MSSAMKDARWLLAMELANAEGVAWFDLGHEAAQLRLDAAQEQLDTMAPEAIQSLADKWNGK